MKTSRPNTRAHTARKTAKPAAKKRNKPTGGSSKSGKVTLVQGDPSIGSFQFSGVAGKAQTKEQVELPPKSPGAEKPISLKTRDPVSQQLRALPREIAAFAARNSVYFCIASTFVVLFCCINWQLFTTPIYEDGDFAANALQVQRAKHFSELLGNYSRFGFHHPGPAFFYVFAAGEELFFDILHIVPAPANAEMLAEILLNVTFLVLTFKIIRAHCYSTLFLPLATAGTVLFLYAVAHAVPGSPMVSIWPPHFILFCFPFFAVACASVVAGRWDHLPLMAWAGMMLVHAHVAQIMFAGTLAAVALAIAALRERKRGPMSHVIRQHRTAVLATAGIFALFVFPIALEWSLHRPNNIDFILKYTREHPGLHNSFSQSLLYLASFFMFTPRAEQVLASAQPTLAGLLNPAPFVLHYWAVFLGFASFATVSRFGRRRKAPLFAKYLLGQCALIAGLFIYWAASISGPLFPFNGYFFFSVQWILLLGLSALVADRFDMGLKSGTAIALCCAAVLPLLLIAPELKYVNSGDAGVHKVAESVKSITSRPIYLEFGSDDWPFAAGVASGLRRNGIRFCVLPSWGFMFGDDSVCQSDRRLRFSRDGSCESPCRTVLRHGDVSVEYVETARVNLDSRRQPIW